MLCGTAASARSVVEPGVSTHGDLLLDLIRRASKTPPADDDSPPPPLRYDRARASLDRQHATYIVAAYVAGAAEPRTIQERNPNQHLAGRAFLATAAAQA
jgi:hypothetical protein